MTCIGEKTNLNCAKHCLPLISSDTRKRICTCGKKEHICCPELNCMDNTTMDEVIFISANQNINKDKNNSCYTNVSDETSITNTSLTSGMIKTSINHENFLTLA